MGTWTRRALRQRIGGSEFCGDLITGTALSGSSASQIVDTTLKYPDDAFNYAYVYVTSGSAENNERTITDWTQSSGVLLVDRDFGASIAANTTYEIHRRFSPTRKNDAINAAIRESKFVWARIIENTSLSLVANQYTYALANFTVSVDEFRGIDKIEMDAGESSTGYSWDEIDSDYWEIRNNDGTLTLQFNSDTWTPTDGRALRVTYRVRPSTLTSDTDASTGTIKPDNESFAAFICARATAILFEWRATQEEETNQREHWLQRVKYYNEQAGLLRGDARKIRGGRVTGGAWRSVAGITADYDDTLSSLQ